MTLRTDITADTAQGDPDYEHHEQHNEANTAILDQEERLVELEGSGVAHPNLATHDAMGLATDVELQAHVTDTADAHDASAISTSGATPSNVQDVVDDHEDRIVTLEESPGGGVSDHGALTGLADDDHAQYHNDTRGDARYWPLTTDLATQVELDGHLTDTDDAHDASAISTSGATPSNVQVVLDDHDDRITAANVALVAHDADDDAHAPAFDAFAQTLVQFSPNPMRNQLLIVEDFVGGSATSGSIGTHGWTATTVAGSPSNALPASNLNGEPGFHSLTVTATNDSIGLHLDPMLFVGSPAYTFETRTRISTVNAGVEDVSYRFGLQSTSASIRPPDGAWFEHITGASGTLIGCVTRDASGTAQVNGGGGSAAGVALNTDWHTYTIVCDGGGSISFYMDDTLLFTHTTVSAAGVLTPRFNLTKSVSSGSPAARSTRVGSMYLNCVVAR